MEQDWLHHANILTKSGTTNHVESNQAEKTEKSRHRQGKTDDHNRWAKTL
jgi:hypothetical protein